jgi:predicted phosphoadenosine phosphosulfate sulfurtransferase
VTSWETRCYSDGIPDSVPNKLLFSGRVPSYKAIAMCILSGDMQLQKLGLSRCASKLGEEIESQLKRTKSNQGELF